MISSTQARPISKTKERLNEVLSVAARLIAHDGYEKASIRAIARETRLSQAGLYHYFSSKEELLYKIQKHTFTVLRNSLAARLDPSASPAERLEVMIRNHLEFFISHMNELCVCAFEANKLSGAYHEEVGAIQRDYFRIACSIVEEVLTGNPTDRVGALDGKRVTLYLFGSLNWIHMWFDTDRATDVEVLVKELTEMVLYGIHNGQGDGGG